MIFIVLQLISDDSPGPLCEYTKWTVGKISVRLREHKFGSVMLIIC